MKRKSIVQEIKSLRRTRRIYYISIIVLWGAIFLNLYNVYSFYSDDDFFVSSWELTFEIGGVEEEVPIEKTYSSQVGNMTISSDEEHLVYEIKDALSLMGIDGTGEYQNLSNITYWSSPDCEAFYGHGEIEMWTCDQDNFIRSFNVIKEEWRDFALAHELGHYLIEYRYGDNLNELVADEFAHRISGKGTRLVTQVKYETDLLK